MYKVLLVGGGGREHAIASAVSKSEKPHELYCVMPRDNPGIAGLCNGFLIGDETNADAVAAYAKEIGATIAIIGPETPLRNGVVDALEEYGIPSVGQKKSIARLEFDKAWTRNFMQKYNIGGLPKFGVFYPDDEEIRNYIDELRDVAVKPAGLTGGKGVKVMGDQLSDIDAAKAYAVELLKNDVVVIEENLKGEEFTLQAFVDGANLAFSPCVQDHKRRYDGDTGPNTGGMGSYNDSKIILPFMTEQDYEDAKRIMTNTVHRIKEETGEAYRGILYGQFMLTAKGLKVIEFNTRFGDPEAMNVLPLLKTDFLDVCDAIVKGTLGSLVVHFLNKATVCKYAVPEGYPENPAKDAPIKVDDAGDALLFYSGVYENGGVVYTTGSRAVAAVGIADTLKEAEEIAERGISAIEGPLFHRKDIGTEGLVKKRVDHMNSLRAGS